MKNTTSYKSNNFFLIVVVNILWVIYYAEKTDCFQTDLHRITTQSNTRIKPDQKKFLVSSSSSSSSSLLLFSSVSENNELIKDALLGEWEEQHGNYVLRPPSSSEPRALIHFLGGAIVGAAPDLSYRYILEKLSKEGYLIVATPYQLSFDYLSTCDLVLEKFEKIAPDLARQYGPIPVLGVGHSCGALLQVLITCLFTDTPRAGNVLISFNNKQVKDAVPLFDEVFQPFFKYVGEEDGVMAMQLLLEASKYSLQGKLPPDDIVTKLSKSLTPKTLETIIPEHVEIPSILRDTITSTLLSPYSSTLKSSGLLPVAYQTLHVLFQIPSLIDEVASGITEFNPTNDSIEQVVKRAYRARRTLLVQYESDSFDETPKLQQLLNDAEKVMRQKRPYVNFDLQLKQLKGVHVTPLLAPPLDMELISQVENLIGDDTAKDRLFYRDADDTVSVLKEWMEESL